MTGKPRRTDLVAISLAIVFRWVCFAVMVFLAVCNEARPGVRLEDPFLELFPHLPIVERMNYWIWLVAWIPGTLLLLRLDRERFVRLMILGGILALLRGVAVLATGLGPVRGEDLNAAREWTWTLRWTVTADIVNPFSALLGDAPHIWLTKDLFFSGHTATTFLLLLFVWPFPRLRIAIFGLHLLVVASLFFGHIHYTVDVVGGYLVAGGVYWLGRRRMNRIGDGTLERG